MSRPLGFAWLAVSAVIASLGLAATHGDKGDRNDNAPPAAPAVPGDKEPIQLDPVLATALYRVSLQPDNLTAGGVTDQVADDVVIGVKGWLAENATALPDADDRFFRAITSRDELVRKVRSGLASPQEIRDCQAASAECDAASAARAALLDQVFNAGTVVLAQDQINTLARIRVNQAAWNVPLEFLVLDRTQEEWVHLRAALANERISAKVEEDPDARDQEYLAGVRADSTISTAKVNLDTRLAGVKSAWEAAAAKE